MGELISYRLSEYDEGHSRQGNIYQRHHYQQQRRKSVSFFDIDTVHYYHSDDDAEADTSDSNDSCQAAPLNYKEIQNDITDKINQKSNEQKSGPYFRIDMSYKIPIEYIEKLQLQFKCDIDFVGGFFTDVYMYEVWTRLR
jgi:hypothetical protein